VKTEPQGRLALSMGQASGSRARMSAAERVEEVDAFGVARVQFAGMEKRLTSPDMLTAQHGQLEEYVIEHGRELQRLLLQAHMDLRAALEERAEVRWLTVSAER
jgi:hypothetical protein